MKPVPAIFRLPLALSRPNASRRLADIGAILLLLLAVGCRPSLASLEADLHRATSVEDVGTAARALVLEQGERGIDVLNDFCDRERNYGFDEEQWYFIGFDESDGRIYEERFKVPAKKGELHATMEEAMEAALPERFWTESLIDGGISPESFDGFLHFEYSGKPTFAILEKHGGTRFGIWINGPKSRALIDLTEDDLPERE